MAKRDFVPNDDASLAVLLEKFAAAGTTYGTTIGFSAADQAVFTADATAFRYTLTQQQRLRTSTQQYTQWKDALRDGGDGTTAGAPVYPAAPSTVPTMVTPGVVGRLRAAARRVKASPNYSVAIGIAFGVEGEQEQTPETVTLQPVLTTTLSGGRVQVGWTRGAADALELHVDRGDGKGFVFLAVDTVPDYIDTETLPVTPAVWKYKAMYRKNDETVGQWSAPVSIGVGG
jgi:hypothetical protein